MIGTLLELMHKISDHGNAMLSKMTYQFGTVVGVGGGAATYATKNVQPKSELVIFLQEWTPLVSVIAAILLIIKTAYDIYLNHKEDRRKDEAHEKDMNE